jgi:hypothetical protein
MTANELNALVSHLVMGEETILASEFGKEHDLMELATLAKDEDQAILKTGRPIPHYCGSMEQAFYVVAVMRKKQFLFSMLWEPGQKAVVSFVKSKLSPLKSVMQKPREKEYIYAGDTPAQAVCLSAVAALGQPNIIIQS